MIHIYSIQQALSLRGIIPELAIIRAMQFMGDGYDPEEHGHIIVIEQGDDITRIKEIGDDGFFTDDVPNYEYVEAFLAGAQVTFELVYQLDDSRTVAVIITDESERRWALYKRSTLSIKMRIIRKRNRQKKKQGFTSKNRKRF